MKTERRSYKQHVIMPSAIGPGWYLLLRHEPTGIAYSEDCSPRYHSLSEAKRDIDWRISVGEGR